MTAPGTLRSVFLILPSVDHNVCHLMPSASQACRAGLRPQSKGSGSRGSCGFVRSAALGLWA
jgi:hypothetical protein